MRRMMHPQHGFHVVSAGDDVELMRRNGWTDDDGKALAAKLAPSAVPAVFVAHASPAPLAVKRGPGRPRKG